MGDGEALLTLADLARQLRATSTRTARRALLKAMENDPGLRITRRGRTILFTEAQFARTMKALEWSPRCPTRAARTVSVQRTGRAAQSAQEAVHERMQELRRRRKRPPAPSG